MDFSRIPDELKQLNQWVCAWDTSKVPMRAYERKAASSTDKTTWSEFAQAQWAVENNYYDWLGFVFADNGIIGIDIDCGFKDGLMSETCADIMQKCHSYTEKSKSGRGVHIYLKGKLPFSGKNNFQGVEIYKEKRFFVVTGQRFVFSEIIENQDAIDYVVEKYFTDIQKSVKSKGDKDKNKISATEHKNLSTRIYNPTYRAGNVKTGSRIRLAPEYPEIKEGGRNLSLLSVAGNMWNTGYTVKQIYHELQRINEQACKPPLSDGELQRIAESISRYERR